MLIAFIYNYIDACSNAFAGAQHTPMPINNAKLNNFRK